jgi:phage major head subunit gpT-like protein
MIINRANLEGLRVGFKTNFQGGIDQTATAYARVATVVPSTTGEEKYGWLGKIPGVREWIGPRQVQNLAEHDYAIKNRDFELTIGVERNHIQDDTLGMYSVIFQNFGESVAAWPDQLVFSLLKSGHLRVCYDGQNFFDTNHPVIQEDGTVGVVSNSFSGAGAAWYLLVVNRTLKPLIWQLRNKGQFVALDKPDDDNVFRNKEFQYGWDGRGNAGFGFWQMAVRSTKTLDATAYEEAITALGSMKGDHGRPLNLLNGAKPLLVVPRSLMGAANGVVLSQLVNGGETNKWAGTADPFVCDWLN